MDEIIYCCRLTDEAPTADLTCEFLTALELQFSSWLDKELNASYHTVYAEDQESAESVAYLLESQMKNWQDLGLKVKEIKVITIKKEDWTEAWKSFFKIQHLSDRLVIKPSWLDYTATPGQVVIEINPGMSFGTGRHATTRFCLKMLDKLAQRDNSQTVLDAGCGSGILTIAASKLNYADIVAFDIDPDAVTVAHENLELNQVDEINIKLSAADFDILNPAEEKYDVVIANILSPVLLKNRDILKASMKPDGYLILAGILQKEYPDIRSAFCELGLEEELTLKEDEWQGGLFKQIP